MTRAGKVTGERASTVTIKMTTNWGNLIDREVAGFTVGAWAVHRIPTGRLEPEASKGRGWRVSHLATGASLARLADDLTLAEATAIAAKFDREFPPFTIADKDLSNPVLTEMYRYIGEQLVGETLWP